MQPIRPIDPVITFKNSQGDSGRGTLTSLQRRSLIMEIYNPYSIIQASEVLTDLTISTGSERNIYKGKAVVVSLMNTGLMAVVSVTLIDEWNELNAIHHDLTRVKEEAKNFVTEWNSRFKVRHDYQVVISEMRSYFAEITRWIDQADISTTLPKDHNGKIRQDVFFDLGLPLLEKGKDYLERFEYEASLIEPEFVAVHRSYAQTAIHPLILRAPFVYRTFAKPLGYAGDYEMVNQILGDPRQGPSTYFQLVNFMFLQAKVAEAHRNRINILAEMLKNISNIAEKNKTKFRIMTLGCGPAVEIERYIKENENFDCIEFVLIDFSEETLKFTKNKLEQLAFEKNKKIHLSIQHESVNQILKRASRINNYTNEEKYDYIYCAGLFDYLSDKVCVRLIEYFCSILKSNAKLLLTNVHKNNPEKNWMEHFLEWYLIYRNESEMIALLPSHLILNKCYTDNTGVNVFVETTMRH